MVFDGLKDFSICARRNIAEAAMVADEVSRGGVGLVGALKSLKKDTLSFGMIRMATIHTRVAHQMQEDS